MRFILRLAWKRLRNLSRVLPLVANDVAATSRGFLLAGSDVASDRRGSSLAASDVTLAALPDGAIELGPDSFHGSAMVRETEKIRSALSKILGDFFRQDSWQLFGGFVKILEGFLRELEGEGKPSGQDNEKEGD